MHQMFYENIEREYAGKYRDMDVFINGSKYPVAESGRIQIEMDELFQWIEGEREKLHPVVFAAQLHKQHNQYVSFKELGNSITKWFQQANVVN